MILFQFALVSDDEARKDYLRFVWKPNSDTNGHIEFRLVP